jgi:fructoselysine-6-P-deglycase FrlB-like protein
METTTPADLARAVDELATIRAQIADLKAKEETRRLYLIAAGVTEADGTQHRVTISTTYKVSIDWKTIAERLNPSTQLITAHTHKAEEPTYTLRLSGRKVTK